MVVKGENNYTANERCSEHLASCKRFLKFLTNLEYNFTEESKDGLINKQLDFQNAIKIYNEVGIQ